MGHEFGGKGFEGVCVSVLEFVRERSRSSRDCHIWLRDSGVLLDLDGMLGVARPVCAAVYHDCGAFRSSRQGWLCRYIAQEGPIRGIAVAERSDGDAVRTRQHKGAHVFDLALAHWERMHRSRSDHVAINLDPDAHEAA